MSDSRDAPEVRAANRALGRPDQPPAIPISRTVPLQGSNSDEVDRILAGLLTSEQVDIIGVLPSHCSIRLVQLFDELRSREPHASLPARVRYFTPARERVMLYRQPGVLGTLVQRWISGVTGLRNWLAPRTADPNASDRLTIYEFNDLYLDCIVYARSGSDESAAIISQLPIVAPPESPVSMVAPELVVSRMSAEQVRDLHSYLSNLEDHAIELTPRQIRCAMDSSMQVGDEFTPAIRRIAPYGRLAPDDVEPISVVAVCVRTPAGPSVILKQRNEHNSRDDFSTLSLISERVLLEDLVDPTLGPLADLEDALDDLWIRSGQPEEFSLPEKSFRNAAQRELFLSCGLDVHTSRLELVGSTILDREQETTYLGFFIYKLDLMRNDEVDELKQARSWNTALTVVPARDLFGRTYRPRLNRLLRRKEDWLRRTIFDAL